MNRKKMLGDHLADEDFEKISELGAGNGGKCVYPKLCNLLNIAPWILQNILDSVYVLINFLHLKQVLSTALNTSLPEL